MGLMFATFEMGIRKFDDKVSLGKKFGMALYSPNHGSVLVVVRRGGRRTQGISTVLDILARDTQESE
jgi:hypothetical protein